jgi:HlyD family secretion protein
VFPQITAGRFTIELLFEGESPPGMNPGQSIDTRLTLGESSAALLVPNDAWLDDSGGGWIFVLAQNRRSAERRAIRIGRRNNTQVEIIEGLAADERVLVSGYARFGKSEQLEISH